MRNLVCLLGIAAIVIFTACKGDRCLPGKNRHSFCARWDQIVKGLWRMEKLEIDGVDSTAMLDTLCVTRCMEFWIEDEASASPLVRFGCKIGEDGFDCKGYIPHAGETISSLRCLKYVKVDGTYKPYYPFIFNPRRSSFHLTYQNKDHIIAGMDTFDSGKKSTIIIHFRRCK